MHSYEPRRFHSFQADASALGGYLDHPVRRFIPTAAPSSLSPVGGFATARSAASNHDEIVSFSAAYSTVTGRVDGDDGSIATQATAVVEDLNILEVVTARRIVAQLSVVVSSKRVREISLAGSRFEGLKLAGYGGDPVLDSNFQQPSLTIDHIRQAGMTQAAKLTGAFPAGRAGGADQWVEQRHGWMKKAPPADGGHPLLASLVDSVPVTKDRSQPGHIIDIPGFGRIFLAELIVSRHLVQFVSIRVELGCPVKGAVAGPASHVSGGGGAPDT
jgi:hypothetical protein